MPWRCGRGSSRERRTGAGGAAIRLLIVSDVPLRAELGAAQVALNLAEALAARGHQVGTWAPPPLPPEVRWWQDWLWRRRRLEAFLATVPPFDAIDLPALTISPRVARHSPTVARSTQPLLLYARAEARAELRRFTRAPLRTPAHLLQGLRLAFATLRSWRRASVLLCLGTGEREWMARHLPWTRPKLATYFNTVGREEQRSLARVRAERGLTPRQAGAGLRFLWIGRWTGHKGPERLLRFVAERASLRHGDTFTLAGVGAEAEDHLPAGLVSRGTLRVIPRFGRAELPGLLAEHDAGLFTSVAEGWGLTLNEMLESGLPVFATEAGGVRDLRSRFPQTLLPFPPPLDFDPSACREAGLEAYFRDFTWEAIAERYEREVLSRLPGQAGGSGS